MKIKENIFDSINKMNANELAFIYHNIKLLENIKPITYRKKPNLSIEQIHQLTDSSKKSWSETIIEAREERI